MEKILFYITLLIKPSFWYMNNPYNRGWDNRISNAIESNAKIENIREHTCEIDGVLIWISNYPYAYGTPYPNSEYRPSRYNIERLATYINMVR